MGTRDLYARLAAAALVLILVAVALRATASPSAGRHFAHPGVLLGARQLAFVQAQAAAGVPPFNDTLGKALADTWVNGRNASSMSPGWNGTISCGYYDSRDYGCRNESGDATAVLVQAMLWAVTRDPRWATRAIGILNFYGQRLRQYAPWGNGLLEAAWAADKWARAAEILATTGAPWAPADVAAFRAMLQAASVPVLYGGSCFNGNWELAMIEGLSSIAVFTENVTLWDHAMDMWRARLPAYFYMASDGPRPAQVRDCRPYWYNQVVFNASVDGVSQETCRDFGHLSYGLASTFNVAETALLQGVDLYTPHAARLRAALEFHTALLNAGGYPANPYRPPLRNVSSPLVCNGTTLRLSYAATYQVGLTGMQRLLGSGLAGGVAAAVPQTTKYVQDWVWNLAKNDACSEFMYCFEALTHGAAAPPQ